MDERGRTSSERSALKRECVRPLLAGGIILIAAWVGFGEMTRDFSAFTSEEARRIDIRRAPARIPDFRVRDLDGRQFGLFDDRRSAVTKPRVTIVSFMYTRCVSICTTTGSSFEQLQRQIVADRLQGAIRLITVSIDPEHDTAEALARYALRVHADPDVWTIVSVARMQDMASVVRAFGVVVLRLPSGDIQHNAAFHVVDGEDRLRAIVDVDAPGAAFDIAGSLALPPGAS